MSLFNVPLSTANSVYNLSVVILVGGIALVFISLLSMLWSSVVKQKYAEQRIAQNEAAVSQAREALLKAREDAAAASKLLTAAKEAAADLQKQREESPAFTGREISADKRDLFKLFVRDFSKGRILIACTSDNPEAENYMKQLAEMLDSAGYTVVPKTGPTIPIPNSRGVHIRIRSMAQQPAYAGSLQKGLEYIGVDTAGELDDAAEDAVLILVGSKS